MQILVSAFRMQLGLTSATDGDDDDDNSNFRRVIILRDGDDVDAHRYFLSAKTMAFHDEWWAAFHSIFWINRLGGAASTSLPQSLTALIFLLFRVRILTTVSICQIVAVLLELSPEPKRENLPRRKTFESRHNSRD